MKIPTKKPERIALFLTHWTNRELHSNFLKLLHDPKAPALWRESGIDLFIACHGTDEISSAVYDSMFVISYYIDSTNSRCADLAHKILTEIRGLEEYVAVGFMDDDAYIPSPKTLYSGAMAAIAAGAGAMGPIPPFRFIHRYHQDRTPNRVWDLKVPCWTTMGCQLYSTNFLQKTRPIWSQHMHRFEHNFDAFMFMLAHTSGYRMMEFNSEGYRHSVSLGKTGHATDAKWYFDRMKTAAVDTNIQLEVFPQLRDEIMKNFRHYLSLMNSHYQKNGEEDIQLLRNWNEVQNWWLTNG